MIPFLVLRFDAPAQSFGGVVIDENGFTDPHPTTSQVTGLLGNALGWQHRDVDKLQQLQARLVLGSRRDRAGTTLTDFQTVDLGQPAMAPGWTTRGTPSQRKGASGTGTHIRHRHYLADAIYTLVVSVVGDGASPSLGDLESALREPARPLFLGRKACIPSGPILVGQVVAANVHAALQAAPLAKRHDAPPHFDASWPADGTAHVQSTPVERNDLRSWADQTHVGARPTHRGPVEVAHDA